MDFLTIANRWRALAHTDIDDYTNDFAVEDWNLVYQDLVDRIVSVTKWDYFWDKWTSDTVVDQSEYLAEKLGIAPDDLDIKKINKVFIKYTTDQDSFQRVRFQNPWALAQHPDVYKEWQPESDPFFYIQDNSVFVYPAPTEIVSWGIEIFVIHKPAELDIDSVSDDIEIPAQFHRILADWLVWYIFQRNGELNEAQLASQRYEQGIQDMIVFMKDRYNQPINRTYTNNLNSYR